MAMLNSKFILCYYYKIARYIQVVDSVAMANGIAASLDFKTIYLAATAETRVS